MKIHVGSIIKASIWISSLTACGSVALAAQVGQILVCYACTGTGNAAIDAALTANPGVATDGLLFAFVNTSASAITGGIFSVSNSSPADSFVVPALAAGGTYIFIPGVTNDGGVHPAGSLFNATGVKDTSDGDGGLTDASIFKFTGLDAGLAVSSTTAGSSTGTPGTFTPGDPGLAKPFRDNPANGSTSFLGLGPNGDGGCNNCYFGLVATLNTPSVSSVPEPSSYALLMTGLSMAAWVRAKRRVRRFKA
jgi:hypothetical protein